MRTNLSVKAYLWLCLVTLPGCYLTYNAELHYENGQISATYEPAKNANYSVNEIAVQKLDCENDCMYWQVIGNNPNLSGSMVYGMSAPGLEVREPARTLVSGKYRLSIGIIFPDKDGELTEHLVLNEFSLVESKGELSLVTHN